MVEYPLRDYCNKNLQKSRSKTNLKQIYIEKSLPDFVEIIITTRILFHVMFFITTADGIRLPPFVNNLDQTLFFKRSETRNSFFKHSSTYVSGISFMSKILVN